MKLKGAAVLLVLVFASCATINSSPGPAVIKPVGKVQLDTSTPFPLVHAPTLIDAGNGAVITVGQGKDGSGEITLFDRDLRLIWRRSIGPFAGSVIDHRGAHIQNAQLHIPMLTPHADEVKEYSVMSFVLATGEPVATSTLLRLNRHDVGALPGEYWSRQKLPEQYDVQPVWSPDSSKVLLFKKYGASSGRISIEMLLYKRGFSLITKNNIDFKLDTNTQSLIDILIDNDGVAYLFLLNEGESSIEVGRFEVLGSKKIRTIKYQSPWIASSMGSVSVAPRGHAYVAIIGTDSLKSVGQLIDLDFYQDRPRMVELASFPPIFIHSRLSPPEIFLAPNVDRLIVKYDETSESHVITDHLYAFDLDLAPAWNYTQRNPAVRMGRHSDPPRTRAFDRSLGYLWTERDTLMWYRVDMTHGTASPSYLIAVIKGDLSIDAAYALGRRLYLSDDRLYRFTLP